MSMVGFPLLLIPLAIYNIFVFLMPGVAFTSPLVSVPLLSRAQWTLTFGDALLATAMLLLWLEIVKASRPGARYLTDHLLSLIVFGGAVAEFLMLGAFGTSTFFLLTVLTGVEFLAGVSLGLRNRRYATTTAAVPVRHEPEIDDKSAIVESTRQEPTSVVPEDQKPPAMTTILPAHEAAKPDPTLAVNSESATPRKLSEWSAADLLRDDPEKTDVPPKS